MNTARFNRVTVIGSGGWGTALAVHLARLGKKVSLWGRNKSLIEAIAKNRINTTYLPGIEIPDLVNPVTSLEVALRNTSCLISAVPSHGTRDVFRQAKPYVPAEAIVVSATKGLEVDTLCRMSEVIEQELGTGMPIAVLSGPSFAIELARESPTAVSVAGRSMDVVTTIQQEFCSRSFRLYATEDVVGVEIGGAMKNVIAIAAGVAESLGLGNNALAALITRGLAEISRLAVAIGGRRETLAGLSGLGDLALTCTGALSRNRAVGIELGHGRQLQEILVEMQTVAEGVRTTGVVLELGLRNKVELPITVQMAEVLAGRKEPLAAVEELMLRPQRSEIESE